MSRVEPQAVRVVRSEHDVHWTLDPEVSFLNHGSFGACPRVVLEAQARYRAQMESEPVRFFVEELEPLLDESRGELAAFLGCDANELVFVPNATAGVNAVLRSLEFRAGDELLTTNHEYNACQNALRFVAERSGARIVTAEIPFPIRSEQDIVRAIIDRVSAKTRLALISAVTSPTAIVFPIAAIVRELSARGVETLVDAAHAPGMIDLNISALGATYVTGNCHKWMCAPKGAGFLHVQPSRQEQIRPLSISHGANTARTDKSRFQIEFGWTGTSDPTPYLCVKDALRIMPSLHKGGWPAIREANRTKALDARDILCAALNVTPPVPDQMIGSMASVPLPDSTSAPTSSSLYADPLQMKLVHEWGIQVPIVSWPSHPRRLVRVSAQLYNREAEYERLAEALVELVKP